jgi:SnoaL-like domain
MFSRHVLILAPGRSPTSNCASAVTGPSFEDRIAISDAITLFYRLVDNGRASQTADMFTDDARLTFGPGSPKPGTISGPDIRDAMIAREALVSAFTRHTVANIAFGEVGSSISADYILTLYRSDDETRSSVPAFVADVAEIWHPHDNGWRISERIILPTFSRS